MSHITGFIEHNRKSFSYEEVNKRANHWSEFVKKLPEEELRNQASRCMDCGVPFCHHACPLGNIIPDFNDLVYLKNYKEAFKSLTSTNNFPEFTGKICPAPCEASCVLKINNDPVTIKNIELDIIDRAFEKGWVQPNVIQNKTGKKIAIIGSGPAGLACASQLNFNGHHVSVFEKENKIGGLLRYGIPDFKLEKFTIDRRIEIMVKSGIEFKTNSYIGRDISSLELLKQYDAVVLATGSLFPRNMNIKGREAKNIYFAMEFLRQSNRRIGLENITDEEQIYVENKEVVIIGGGYTGLDCIGTSVRQKVKRLTHIVYRKDTPLPWPYGDNEIKTSWQEAEKISEMVYGDLVNKNERNFEILYDTLAKEFIKDENNLLKGVKCVKIKWIREKNKKPHYQELTGSEFVISADYVFLSIGFLHPNHNDVIKEFALELTECGTVKDENYHTSKEKVFVAGDMRIGQSLVVSAISEGRECARSIDKYLQESKSTGLLSKDKSFLSKD